MTHTYVELEVSAKAFKEIWQKLKKATYYDQLEASINGKPLLIDMHGIALVKKK